MPLHLDLNLYIRFSVSFIIFIFFCTESYHICFGVLNERNKNCQKEAIEVVITKNHDPLC